MMSRKYKEHEETKDNKRSLGSPVPTLTDTFLYMPLNTIRLKHTISHTDLHKVIKTQ